MIKESQISNVVIYSSLIKFVSAIKCKYNYIINSKAQYCFLVKL